MDEERTIDVFWDAHQRGLLGMVLLVTGDRQVSLSILEALRADLAEAWQADACDEVRKRQLYRLAVRRLRAHVDPGSER